MFKMLKNSEVEKTLLSRILLYKLLLI